MWDRLDERCAAAANNPAAAAQSMASDGAQENLPGRCVIVLSAYDSSALQPDAGLHSQHYTQGPNAQVHDVFSMHGLGQL